MVSLRRLVDPSPPPRSWPVITTASPRTPNKRPSGQVKKGMLALGSRREALIPASFSGEVPRPLLSRSGNQERCLLFPSVAPGAAALPLQTID